VIIFEKALFDVTLVMEWQVGLVKENDVNECYVNLTKRTL